MNIVHTSIAFFNSPLSLYIMATLMCTSLKRAKSGESERILRKAERDLDHNKEREKRVIEKKKKNNIMAESLNNANIIPVVFSIGKID